MIFGTSRLFLKQLTIKWLFNFPPHPTSASTLPGENRKGTLIMSGSLFFETQCISGVLCFLFVSVSSIIESLCTVLNFQCFVT